MPARGGHACAGSRLATKKERRDKSIGRILYAGRTRRAIIPLGAALLPCSSHLPACSSEPLSGPWPTHAYLMLLRIEVAAFHPAAPRPVAKPRGTEVAVPVHAGACPRRRLVSVALFLGPRQPESPLAGRPLAAIPLCGVRTFLDTEIPRLPDLPRNGIV